VATVTLSPNESASASPLLSRPGAVAAGGVDTGVAWHYGDPTGEQRALAAGSAVADLSHLGVVTVSGPDRLSWLNSITSQELTELAPRTSTELLVLSPHGHIEHAAGVVDDGEVTWLLTESASAASLAAWLDSMRFMLRVVVTDASADWAVLGEPVATEARAGEPLSWLDPWPHTLLGGTRYGPDDDAHPAANRRWRLVLVPRAGCPTPSPLVKLPACAWSGPGRRRRSGSPPGDRAPVWTWITAPSRTSSTGSAPRCT